MKVKITVTATCDFEAKAMREELGIDAEDDIFEALQTHLNDSVELGLGEGDTTIESVDVTKTK